MAADTLIIIPTRSRVSLAERAVRAIGRTAHEPVDVLLVVNEDQDSLYGPLVWDLRQSLVAAGPEVQLGMKLVDNSLAYSGKLNLATQNLPREYRYIGLWNDDHEAITPRTGTRNKEFFLSKFSKKYSNP